MSSLLDRFRPIQEAVDAQNYLNTWPYFRVLVSEVNGMLNVDFCASPFEASYDDFLNLLCEAEIAERLKMLTFHAPDIGANGTREWSFDPLIAHDVVFPYLTHLQIELYNHVDHNRPIISRQASLKENGTLAHLLDKAPSLLYLEAPSAPNEHFFARRASPLQYMHIQAGYDPQSFIQNWSASACFPDLRRLVYRDYDETYMSDYPQQCTPFEAFVNLFQSAAFDPVKTFIWYNPIFDHEQLTQLYALRPAVSLKIVRAANTYVR